MPDLLRRAAGRFPLAGIVTAAVLLTACDDPEAPSSFTPAILVDVSETGGFAALDDSYVFRGHFGDFARTRQPLATSEDHSRLVFLAIGGAGPPELVVFDAKRLRAEYREDPARIDSRSIIGAVAIQGTLGIVMSGEDIILNGAHNGVPGVIRLSGEPFVPVAFGGPYHLEVLGAALQSGLLYVLGSRQEHGPTHLFSLDPQTLAPLDSTAALGARQVLSSPDGRHLFLYGSELRKFDTRTGDFVATVASPTPNLHADLFIAQNGNSLFLSDPGNYFEDPGPGIVYRWSEDLVPLQPLDLNGLNRVYPHIPPVVGGITTNSTGDTIFLSIGSGSRGPLYGPQPAELLVMNPATQEVIARTDLEGWSPRSVIVVSGH